MTRRTGIIALLATISGVLTLAQKTKPEEGATLWWGQLPDTSRLIVYLGRVGNTRGFDPIEITDGTRTVMLTAKDIMDALLSGLEPITLPDGCCPRPDPYDFSHGDPLPVGGTGGFVFQTVPRKEP